MSDFKCPIKTESFDCMCCDEDLCARYKTYQQGKTDAIEELLKQVQKEEMWLFKVIGSNQNINIAFGGIYAKAEQLKEQKNDK